MGQKVVAQPGMRMHNFRRVAGRVVDEGVPNFSMKDTPGEDDRLL